MQSDNWIRKTMSVPQPIDPVLKEDLCVEHEAAVRATLTQQSSSAFRSMAEPQQAAEGKCRRKSKVPALESGKCPTGSVLIFIS